MVNNRQESQNMRNDTFNTNDWESDTASISTFHSDQAFVNTTQRDNPARVCTPRIEVTQCDGSNISLMEKDPPSNTGHSTSVILQSWTYEILSCFLAVIAMIAIISLLRMYDGNAVSEWRYAITINSILSILITLIKAMVIVPLAEGLSQLKWSWFEQKERSVQDLVTFDEASRGVWGASKLVLFVRPWHLVWIGSVIFLASFAIGPFAQQAMQIRLRNVNTTDIASVPICFNPDLNYTDSVLVALYRSKVTKPTLGAIYEGMFKYDPAVGSSVGESVVCPGGNCTFPPYQSLGICSRCEDVTNLLAYRICRRGSGTGANKNCIWDKELSTKEQCEAARFDDPVASCRYELPNTHRLKDTMGFSSYTGNRSMHPSMQLLPSFLNLTTIQQYKLSFNWTWSATECSLYYCVHEHKGVSVGGKFVEASEEVPSVVKSDSELTHESYMATYTSYHNVTLSPAYCILDGKRKEPPYTKGDGCEYTFNGDNAISLGDSIQPLIEGQVGKQAEYVNYDQGVETLSALYDAEDESVTPNRVFEGLGAVLTSHIRSYPGICEGSVRGMATRNESFIFVVWWWMIYPTFIVAGSTFFLVMIIVKSRHQHIWKSSPLALVFSGLYQGPHMQAARILRDRNGPEVSSMEDVAMGMKARLKCSGDWDVRFSGAERQDVGSVMENIWLWRRFGKWIKGC